MTAFDADSVAETILKVGAPVRRKAPEKNFFWSWPSTFLALNVQLVVLVSAFVIVSTVWWFLVRCSSTHGAPMARARPFVKVGTRALWSRRHRMQSLVIIVRPSLFARKRQQQRQKKYKSDEQKRICSNETSNAQTHIKIN